MSFLNILEFINSKTVFYLGLHLIVSNSNKSIKPGGKQRDMSLLNISALEENVGIRLIFLLALTSTFLCFYITMFDIFFSEKKVRNLEIEVVGFVIDNF